MSGGTTMLWSEFTNDERLAGGGPVAIINNVMAATTLSLVARQVYVLDATVEAPATIENNILLSDTFGSWTGEFVWHGFISARSTGTMHCDDVEPADAVPTMRANLYWGSTFPELLGYLGCSTGYDDDLNWSNSTVFVEAFAGGFAEADPAFTNSGETGSFALSTTSVAVDAGVGDADPDGSPPDVGAFGGPDGNWFQEYPWPLD